MPGNEPHSLAQKSLLLWCVWLLTTTVALVSHSVAFPSSACFSRIWTCTCTAFSPPLSWPASPFVIYNYWVRPPCASLFILHLILSEGIPFHFSLCQSILYMPVSQYLYYALNYFLHFLVIAFCADRTNWKNSGSLKLNIISATTISLKLGWVKPGA